MAQSKHACIHITTLIIIIFIWYVVELHSFAVPWAHLPRPNILHMHVSLYPLFQSQFITRFP